jgi:hypothetical protein
MIRWRWGSRWPFMFGELKCEEFDQLAGNGARITEDIRSTRKGNGREGADMPCLPSEAVR